MERLAYLIVIAIVCAAPCANAIAPSGPKAMPTPCFAKFFNGFCYVEASKDICTFYSSPTFATLSACLASTNMGKTLSCAEATPAEQKNGNFKTCKDAADLAWGVQTGTDLPKMDVPCAGKEFCKVCGKDSAVKVACAKDPRCKAFTYSASEGCGYLKGTARAPTKATTGWTLFTLPTGTTVEG